MVVELANRAMRLFGVVTTASAIHMIAFGVYIMSDTLLTHLLVDSYSRMAMDPGKVSKMVSYLQATCQLAKLSTACKAPALHTRTSR